MINTKSKKSGLLVASCSKNGELKMSRPKIKLIKQSTFKTKAA